MHLNEVLCFSYMSACVKRYFCLIFVLINHILVPILQAWKRAKDCFIKSKIEVLYDERMAKVEEAKQYKGFDQAESQIEIEVKIINYYLTNLILLIFLINKISDN